MPPHNAYQYYPASRPRIINWPKIILWGLGILILGAIIAFFILDPLSIISDKADGLLNQVQGAGYDCSKDIYNCDNFTRQRDAQVIFSACFGESGDIHQLDGDGNGRACEGLA